MKEPCSVIFVTAKIDVTRYTLNLGDNIRKNGIGVCLFSYRLRNNSIVFL